MRMRNGISGVSFVRKNNKKVFESSFLKVYINNMKIKSVGYNIEGGGEILDDREWSGDVFIWLIERGGGYIIRL
jgi:hypothetical protein